MKKQVQVKITIFTDKRIIIENYEKLIDLSEDLIRVDIYSIYGSFLKLRQMDNYMIEILGTINQVVINE